MKRSSFLALIAALFSFLGFKKKPKKEWSYYLSDLTDEWDYMHGPSKPPDPLTWVNHGSIEFGPEIQVMEHVNTSHIDLSGPRVLQACFTDIKDGKYYVHESTDGGHNWVKVREYDLKDMIA